MSCFEDLMQFRDEVEEARKKIRVNGNTLRRMGREKPGKSEESTSQLQANSQ
jgi:hypothetical protein